MQKNNTKYIFIPIITALISVIMLIVTTFIYKPIATASYTEFLNDVANKKVSTVYITNSPKITVALIDGKKYNTDNPRSLSIKETLLKENIKVSEQPSKSFIEIIPIATLIISIIIIVILMIKFSSIKSKGLLSVESMNIDSVDKIGFNFNSVAGNEEAKESVQDIVDFLKNPEKYTSYGARMPKGIILYGEPGTGKTLLAKAVAGEAGVPFYAMSGSDFIQVYVGVGASRIRQLFKKAKSDGKAVIFIDEIDAIGKKRDNTKNGGSDERDQTLNALLTEMSGFNEKEGIIIMAATNRLDMLDPALLRPGRFDRHIEITLPDVSAREKILNLHFKNKPINNINIREWAHKTTYFSGAKIENLVNEAAIIACKESSPYIEDIHIDRAYSIVLAGHEKINRDHINETDRKITAYHEIGHALVSLKVLSEEKISKVTIIPSTKGSGGYTLSIPQDQMYQNKDYLKRRIMVLLGGRAAEDIVFGENFVTTGAYSDLKSSTNIVTNMVTEYGMGNTLGLLSINELSNLNTTNGNDIIIECKNIINSLYDEVKCILVKEKETLEKLTTSLLEKETLFYEDIISILESN